MAAAPGSPHDGFDDGVASPTEAGAHVSNNVADEAPVAEDDDDEYCGLGHIPAQILKSTESDTVRFRVGADDMGACSPDHGRGELLSPTFDGGEIAYSKSAPPVPAALLRSMAEGAAVAPPAAVSGNAEGNVQDLIG